MRRFSFVLFSALLLGAIAVPAEAKPWLRSPALSRTQIAFTYAGDLWIVAREGGDARRLTTGVGVETKAAFSPDGQHLFVSSGDRQLGAPAQARDNEAFRRGYLGPA